MPVFKGAGVAIVTPFKDNGDIDFDKFGEQIDFQIRIRILIGKLGSSKQHQYRTSNQITENKNQERRNEQKKSRLIHGLL